jgi:hypothetical protein
MTSVIDRLAATLPLLEDESREHPVALRRREAFRQATVLATRVCDLVRAGRTTALGTFFDALESEYCTAMDSDSALALHEGFMESLVLELGDFPPLAADLHAHLRPASREIWEQAWSYMHDTPCPKAAGA